jgi:hypothetical protein
LVSQTPEYSAPVRIITKQKTDGDLFVEVLAPNALRVILKRSVKSERFYRFERNSQKLCRTYTFI